MENLAELRVTAQLESLFKTTSRRFACHALKDVPHALI
jgi:hypothetical protein